VKIIILCVGLLVAWSWVCVTLGRIWQIRRDTARLQRIVAADMDQLDEWATNMEQKQEQTNAN